MRLEENQDGGGQRGHPTTECNHPDVALVSSSFSSSSSSGGGVVAVVVLSDSHCNSSHVKEAQDRSGGNSQSRERLRYRSGETSTRTLRRYHTRRTHGPPLLEPVSFGIRPGLGMFSFWEGMEARGGRTSVGVPASARTRRTEQTAAVGIPSKSRRAARRAAPVPLSPSERSPTLTHVLFVDDRQYRSAPWERTRQSITTSINRTRTNEGLGEREGALRFDVAARRASD
jgi:hypothetical protein